MTCEVTTHHFSLDDSGLLSYDTNMKMNPPLRSSQDVEALLEGLADGTIDVIATDHAPHAPHEKETEFDQAEFGAVGLETCLALGGDQAGRRGVLSLEAAVAMLTVAPARIMHMERWGYQAAVREGAPANLVVFNPDLEWTVDPRRSSPARATRLSAGGRCGARSCTPSSRASWWCATESWRRPEGPAANQKVRRPQRFGPRGRAAMSKEEDDRHDGLQR